MARVVAAPAMADNGAAGPDRRTRGFLSQSAGSVLLKGTSVALGFGTLIVLARALGPDAYGTYAVVFALVSVLAIPSQMGLPTLVVRETARAAEAGAADGMRALWRQAGWFVLASSAVILLGTLGWIALGAMAAPYRAALLVALLLIPLRAFAHLRAAALSGLGRVVLGQIPEMALRPGLFLALVGLVWLFAPDTLADHGAAGAFVLHAVAAFVAFLFAWSFLRVFAPPAHARAQSPVAPRAMLLSAGTMGLIVGAQALNANLDVIMLGALSDPATAGIYKIAASTALLSTSAMIALNQVLMPRVAASYKRGDMAAMQAVILRVARLSLGIAALATAVLLAGGDWILGTAFGPEHQAGTPILMILAIAQLGNASFGPVLTVLNMTGHERDSLTGVLIAVGVNIALNAILIPIYGGIGAAIATAATMLSWNAILYIRCRQRLGVSTLAFASGRTAGQK